MPEGFGVEGRSCLGGLGWRKAHLVGIGIRDLGQQQTASQSHWLTFMPDATHAELDKQEGVPAALSGYPRQCSPQTVLRPHSPKACYVLMYWPLQCHDSLACRLTVDFAK